MGTELAGNQSIPISIEYFRMLDSRNRFDRFKKLGLINEPNCEQSLDPDEYGLYLDKWKGDPEHYYPTDSKYPGYGAERSYAAYGEPTGIVGVRKFRNPKFDKSKWDVKEYFNTPWRYEPPYLVGFSCAFCHMAFDPTNPPKDSERPRWENLAANMGNQYFREGDLFFARGRVIFGDRNPGPGRPKDPYDTQGINATSLLFHYAITQQPGTSETSRISYDFINNPNTINSIFYLGNRPVFPETTPDGEPRLVNHVLKDGSDSVGLNMALLRVWINIGCEGRYWVDTLFNPLTGTRQRPLDLQELRLNVSPERQAELKKLYGPDVGQDWAEAHRRNPHLIAYLASYTPFPLQNAPGGDKYLSKDAAQLQRGKELFAKHCAACHSNQQPFYSIANTPEEKAKFFHDSVLAPNFLVNNTLSDDRRYSVTELGTNMARALATNAVDGDVWAQLSSKDYKALPPLGTVVLKYKIANGLLVPKPANEQPDPQSDLVIRFTPPGGGRGYYRTPTLVSMWATAPYLHNNGLGDYCVVKRDGSRAMVPNDGRLIEDPIDTSVEGRLRMFQDAVEKMLWPEKRNAYIKRTQEDCRFADLQPIVKQFLPGALTELVGEFLEENVAKAIDALAQENGLPKPEVTRIKPKLVDLTRTELAELRRRIGLVDVAAVKNNLVTLVQKKLAGRLPDLAGPQYAAALKDKLAILAEKLKQEVDELSDLDVLKIPKGTPVNLYFNLPISAVPYALKAQLKYRHDPRSLADTLLKLSDCPDLVEDKGHTYGSGLKDEEKRDLIEFLKTL